ACADRQGHVRAPPGRAAGPRDSRGCRRIRTPVRGASRRTRHLRAIGVPGAARESRRPRLRRARRLPPGPPSRHGVGVRLECGCRRVRTSFGSRGCCPYHDAMRVTTLDAHVGGAAVRLVTSGLPTLEGTTMAERAASIEEQSDDIRQLLCLEPRGNAGVVGVVLTEPERAEAEAGMLFFDGAGMRPLSRTGVLAATALALDAHLISPREPGRLEV